MDSLKQEIGQRMKLCRTRCGMKQYQVAETQDIVPAAYSKKELGGSWFNAFELKTLTELFEVSLDWLISGKERGATPTPNPAITGTEWRLVRLYRKSTDKGRASLMEAAIDESLESEA